MRGTALNSPSPLFYYVRYLSTPWGDYPVPQKRAQPFDHVLLTKIFMRKPCLGDAEVSFGYFLEILPFISCGFVQYHQNIFHKNIKYIENMKNSLQNQFIDVIIEHIRAAA